MFYYLIKNGKIDMSTDNEKVAQKLGLTLSTNKRIINGFDGGLYFEDELPLPPAPTYKEKRAAEYPPIGEQLDMIYWDKVNGTRLWEEKIAEIKAKYPKE